MLQPGDVVAVDALTYPGFKVLAQAHRLELVPLPAATDGPDLDAFAQLCVTRRIRAIYTMPTLHNPLGWVTSAAVPSTIGGDRPRARTCSSSRTPRTRTWWNSRQPHWQRLRRSRQSTSPGYPRMWRTGLRFGFVVAPTQFIGALERAIRATTWNTPALMTAIATGWLNDGTVTRLEARSAPTPGAGKPSPATFSTDSISSDIHRRTSCGCRCPAKPEPTK